MESHGPGSGHVPACIINIDPYSNALASRYHGPSRTDGPSLGGICRRQLRRWSYPSDDDAQNIARSVQVQNFSHQTGIGGIIGFLAPQVEGDVAGDGDVVQGAGNPAHLGPTANISELNR